MLEKMGAFFEARLDGYDEHMMTAIAGAEEFYPFTAGLLPREPGARVLDLGCGTGLELGEYFAKNPTARVTGIDLAPGMLRALAEKFPDRDLELICGSYFDVPFGADYDGAVSVESLHHFTKEEKIPLYRRLRDALKPGGAFVLTDYFSLSDEEEYGLILRAKGILQTPEGDWFQFDYVPGESELRYGAADYTGRLCVIGCHLKMDAIRALFGI